MTNIASQKLFAKTLWFRSIPLLLKTRLFSAICNVPNNNYQGDAGDIQRKSNGDMFYLLGSCFDICFK